MPFEQYKDCCKCEPLCVKYSAFKRYAAGSSGDLDHSYYASHFDVGAVDDIYHLPLVCAEGQKHILRLVSSAGGQLKVDVDHLGGNNSQIQLPAQGNWAELHYKGCGWHLADHVGAVCT